jgi:UDP-N-acetylmuramoylalanine--D-glutamate ligase
LERSSAQPPSLSTTGTSSISARISITSALVVGLGRSGQAAALALAGLGVSVRAADRSPEVEAGRLAEAGVEVLLGTEDDALVEDVEVVVKSPGVPAQAPPVARARAERVPIWSEVELGYRLLPGNPIVGVTGTKGKTTTVRLLGAVFEAAGRPVHLGGNEHTPLSELALQVPQGDWLVCELSSFQLEDVHTLSCDVAVLLNLEPDHLDRHGTLEAYREAKLRIFERAEVKIARRDLGVGEVHFSADDPLPAEPRIPGLHNRENAAAATAAARAAGIPDDAIATALETFPGVPHRLELIAERGGVRYVNDSKATNVAATLRGIAAYEQPLHIILGGSSKGESFEPLADALSGREAVAYLIGATADELAAALDAQGVRYEPAGELATAVRDAAAAARPGDVVLLSPACASYDQFQNFEERGETFRRLVEELA